ncbi:hypothetical protein LXL04_003173 [Taraxacum kok-saghyz]
MSARGLRGANRRGHADLQKKNKHHLKLHNGQYETRFWDAIPRTDHRGQSLSLVRYEEVKGRSIWKLLPVSRIRIERNQDRSVASWRTFKNMSLYQRFTWIGGKFEEDLNT